MLTPPPPSLPKPSNPPLTTPQKDASEKRPSALPKNSSLPQPTIPYWNEKVAAWSQKLWLPIVSDSAVTSSTPHVLQDSWFSSTKRPPMSTNFPKISLQSSKEEESPDENPTLGKKRKIRTTTARNKRQRLETLNRTLPIKVYPNHHQKQLLKQWMGLSKYAYNAVVRWSRHRRVYTKDSVVGPSRRVWIKSQPINVRTRDFRDHAYGVNANSCKLLCVLECCFKVRMEKRLQMLSMR